MTQPTRRKLKAIAAPKRAKRQRAAARAKDAPKPQVLVIKMGDGTPIRRRIRGQIQFPGSNAPSRYVYEALHRQEQERIAAELMAAKAGSV